MTHHAPPADGTIPDEDVRASLARVLRSAPFRRSPQLQRFLTFLVDERLAGRGERLKEYAIGTEVFGRPASYDPRLDSLVRVEARRLRSALAVYYSSDGREDAIVIELPKGAYLPGFRHAAATRSGAEAETGRPAEGPPWRRRREIAGWRLGGGLALGLGAAALLAFGFLPRLPGAPALAERDKVVLAGFANETGDEVFDDTLKQGLLSELEQSPFFDVVSDRRVSTLLAMMGESPDRLLDPSVARGLCLRAEAKVFITGAIERVGAGYVLGLTVTACETGDPFVHLQREARRKEAVLGALSASARDLRRRLGESLASIQRFGVPLEDATTGSLEALRAYSVGRRIAREQGSPSDVPLYQQALAIDPGFAAARAALGVSLVNIGQRAEGAAHLEAAYALRARVSDREGFRISASYLQAVTGELDEATRTYESWRRSYPREFAPALNLGLAHIWLGDYEKAAAESREAMRLDPGNVLGYTNLAAVLIKLGQRDAAAAVLDEAEARGLSSPLFRLNRAYLAFLQGRQADTEREVEKVRGTPAHSGPLLALIADSQAHAGRARLARTLTREAVASAKATGNREAAATWLLGAALREAEFGGCTAARKEVGEAVGLTASRDILTLAALARARCGDVAEALRLLDDLRQRHPRNSLLASYWGPVIEAAVHLARREPAPALQRLEGLTAIEAGSPPPFGLATLYPAYVRGEAYLALRDGAAASREFQKLTDRPWLALNFCLHAKAYLMLGRAEALAGEAARAAAAYDRFLELWAGADQDSNLLTLAIAERRALGSR